MTAKNSNTKNAEQYHLEALTEELDRDLVHFFKICHSMPAHFRRSQIHTTFFRAVAARVKSEVSRIFKYRAKVLMQMTGVEQEEERQASRLLELSITEMMSNFTRYCAWVEDGIASVLNEVKHFVQNSTLKADIEERERNLYLIGPDQIKEGEFKAYDPSPELQLQLVPSSPGGGQMGATTSSEQARESLMRAESRHQRMLLKYIEEQQLQVTDLEDQLRLTQEMLQSCRRAYLQQLSAMTDLIPREKLREGIADVLPSEQELLERARKEREKEAEENPAGQSVKTTAPLENHLDTIEQQRQAKLDQVNALQWFSRTNFLGGPGEAISNEFQALVKLRQRELRTEKAGGLSTVMASEEAEEQITLLRRERGRIQRELDKVFAERQGFEAKVKMLEKTLKAEEEKRKTMEMEFAFASNNMSGTEEGTRMHAEDLAVRLVVSLEKMTALENWKKHMMEEIEKFEVARRQYRQTLAKYQEQIQEFAQTLARRNALIADLRANVKRMTKLALTEEQVWSLGQSESDQLRQELMAVENELLKVGDEKAELEAQKTKLAEEEKRLREANLLISSRVQHLEMIHNKEKVEASTEVCPALKDLQSANASVQTTVSGAISGTQSGEDKEVQCYPPPTRREATQTTLTKKDMDQEDEDSASPTVKPLTLKRLAHHVMNLQKPLNELHLEQQRLSRLAGAHSVQGDDGKVPVHKLNPLSEEMNTSLQDLDWALAAFATAVEGASEEQGIASVQAVGVQTPKAMMIEDGKVNATVSKGMQTIPTQEAQIAESSGIRVVEPTESGEEPLTYKPRGNLARKLRRLSEVSPHQLPPASDPWSPSSLRPPTASTAGGGPGGMHEHSGGSPSSGGPTPGGRKKSIAGAGRRVSILFREAKIFLRNLPTGDGPYPPPSINPVRSGWTEDQQQDRRGSGGDGQEDESAGKRGSRTSRSSIPSTSGPHTRPQSSAPLGREREQPGGGDTDRDAESPPAGSRLDDNSPEGKQSSLAPSPAKRASLSNSRRGSLLPLPSPGRDVKSPGESSRKQSQSSSPGTRRETGDNDDVSDLPGSRRSSAGRKGTDGSLSAMGRHSSSGDRRVSADVSDSRKPSEAGSRRQSANDMEDRQSRRRSRASQLSAGLEGVEPEDPMDEISVGESSLSAGGGGSDGDGQRSQRGGVEESRRGEEEEDGGTVRESKSKSSSHSRRFSTFSGGEPPIDPRGFSGGRRGSSPEEEEPDEEIVVFEDIIKENDRLKAVEEALNLRVSELDREMQQILNKPKESVKTQTESSGLSLMNVDAENWKLKKERYDLQQQVVRLTELLVELKPRKMSLTKDRAAKGWTKPGGEGEESPHGSAGHPANAGEQDEAFRNALASALQISPGGGFSSGGASQPPSAARFRGLHGQPPTGTQQGGRPGPSNMPSHRSFDPHYYQGQAAAGGFDPAGAGYGFGGRQDVVPACGFGGGAQAYPHHPHQAGDGVYPPSAGEGEGGKSEIDAARAAASVYLRVPSGSGGVSTAAGAHRKMNTTQTGTLAPHTSLILHSEGEGFTGEFSVALGEEGDRMRERGEAGIQATGGGEETERGDEETVNEEDTDAGHRAAEGPRARFTEQESHDQRRQFQDRQPLAGPGDGQAPPGPPIGSLYGHTRGPAGAPGPSFTGGRDPQQPPSGVSGGHQVSFADNSLFPSYHTALEYPSGTISGGQTNHPYPYQEERPGLGVPHITPPAAHISRVYSQPLLHRSSRDGNHPSRSGVRSGVEPFEGHFSHADLPDIDPERISPPPTHRRGEYPRMASPPRGLEGDRDRADNLGVSAAFLASPVLGGPEARRASMESDRAFGTRLKKHAFGVFGSDALQSSQFLVREDPQPHNHTRSVPNLHQRQHQSGQDRHPLSQSHNVNAQTGRRSPPHSEYTHLHHSEGRPPVSQMPGGERERAPSPPPLKTLIREDARLSELAGAKQSAEGIPPVVTDRVSRWQKALAEAASMLANFEASPPVSSLNTNRQPSRTTQLRERASLVQQQAEELASTLGTILAPGVQMSAAAGTHWGPSDTIPVNEPALRSVLEGGAGRPPAGPGGPSASWAASRLQASGSSAKVACLFEFGKGKGAPGGEKQTSKRKDKGGLRHQASKGGESSSGEARRPQPRLGVGFSSDSLGGVGEDKAGVTRGGSGVNPIIRIPKVPSEQRREGPSGQSGFSQIERDREGEGSAEEVVLPGSLAEAEISNQGAAAGGAESSSLQQSQLGGTSTAAGPSRLAAGGPSAHRTTPVTAGSQQGGLGSIRTLQQRATDGVGGRIQSLVASIGSEYDAQARRASGGALGGAHLIWDSGESPGGSMTRGGERTEGQAASVGEQPVSGEGSGEGNGGSVGMPPARIAAKSWRRVDPVTTAPQGAGPPPAGGRGGRREKNSKEREREEWAEGSGSKSFNLRGGGLTRNGPTPVGDLLRGAPGRN
uniref:Uncharacterized protein n=1 Tax=Chromera velia CCMP2878 TaxID=1169474 RepID=A0A0G4HLY4_9ALVE|eukprot:Cvel_7415.t1-p1 / transcript=Cvel_7415.t1 / gene=Cvel_7415 / organism=Chromera_velia_CCMP2878 / gene_product=Myosin heavy chain, non-muscle, putative / transcript_product=Myosin heavy chain, non-muscle, putative / location=Cvel_scaffold387:41605-53142(-) / protein_length=2430 / sequence_SO=supercontig / SO=protein_coding / is_pseudo=false